MQRARRDSVGDAASVIVATYVTGSGAMAVTDVADVGASVSGRSTITTISMNPIVDSEVMAMSTAGTVIDASSVVDAFSLAVAVSMAVVFADAMPMTDVL